MCDFFERPLILRPNTKKIVMRKRIQRSIRISRYIVYRETLVDAREHFWSFLGAFAGMGIIAFMQSRLLGATEQVFLIGSFGASSVLVYGAIESPLAQPRNLVGGHLISAFTGVVIYKLLPDIIWLNAPLAVALSIVLMQITKTLHPPGGATALIAVIGSEKIRALGFMYVLTPVLSGALVLLMTALVFNNLTKKRSYPVKGNLSERIKRILLSLVF